MRTVIVVQARMSSTRLPGKVLREAAGKPLLEFQLERLTRCREAAGVVVATTLNPADAPIVALCERVGAACFRGPEEDVLSRYLGAAREHRAEAVVRVTSDCPLIDPAVVDRVAACLREAAGTLDYVSNTLEQTYPRGMDAEAFTMSALEEAARLAVDPRDREHVTRYIYTHPDRYRLRNVAFARPAGGHRWTVDTPEDFALVKAVIEALYPGNKTFALDDVLAFLDGRPDLVAVNAHVRQKAD